MSLRAVIAVVPLVLAIACGRAPERPIHASPQPGSPAAAVAALPADVASPEAIVAAVYDSVSGAHAGKHDWTRFRSLFAAEGRLVPTEPKKTGGYTLHAKSVEEFASWVDEGSKNDAFYYERGVASRVERYGAIAHVFSTYEGHSTLDGPPVDRGINSFQLFFDGTRWWVLEILWHGETPATPIPPEFLPRGGTSP